MPLITHNIVCLFSWLCDVFPNKLLAIITTFLTDFFCTLEA